MIETILLVSFISFLCGWFACRNSLEKKYEKHLETALERGDDWRNRFEQLRAKQ